MQQLSMEGGGMSIIFVIVLVVIFVVLIIVPNKKREKQFKQMLESIKVGSNIKTIGGVYGKVVAIKEDIITVETGPDKVKILFSKQAIATVENSDYEADMGSK